MGGAVVLQLTLNRPDIPGALVLVATGARLRMRPDFLETAHQRAETMPGNQAVGPTIHADDARSDAYSIDSGSMMKKRSYAAPLPGLDCRRAKVSRVTGGTSGYASPMTELSLFCSICLPPASGTVLT